MIKKLCFLEWFGSRYLKKEEKIKKDSYFINSENWWAFCIQHRLADSEKSEKKWKVSLKGYFLQFLQKILQYFTDLRGKDWKK